MFTWGSMPIGQLNSYEQVELLLVLRIGVQQAELLLVLRIGVQQVELLLVLRIRVQQAELLQNFCKSFCYH
jgi:hypothetical protein